MNNKKGLTISMIFQSQSANYGEGVGNIAQLKKMTRSNGKVYTYISRQAMRYNIVQQMGIDNTPVHKVDNSVMQFTPETTIDKFPEIDLFGYMKTSTGKSKKKDKKSNDDTSEESSSKTSTRNAVVRLSNAISLEPYNADMDYANSMGMANRIGTFSGLMQSEIHNSLYAYTITIDLDKVGVECEKDKNGTEKIIINIPNEEKSKRVIDLLDTIQFLYRDIRGRRENFNPVFAIGGVYERKNPYFEDRLKLNKGNLNTDIIKDVIDSCDDTRNNTIIGTINGYFNNYEDIKKILGAKSISEMFNTIKEEVVQYYA